MNEKKDETRTLEEDVFRTLSHQIRRDIIRFVGESKGVSFTGIKKSTGIEESASLSYHLNALGPLLHHDDGLYRLSELGKDSYSLLVKLVTYSASTVTIGVIKQQLGSAIIANALMWISVIMSLIVLEGPLELMTLYILAAIFSVSNIILYSILQHTKLG